MIQHSKIEEAYNEFIEQNTQVFDARTPNRRNQIIETSRILIDIRLKRPDITMNMLIAGCMEQYGNDYNDYEFLAYLNQKYVQVMWE